MTSYIMPLDTVSVEIVEDTETGLKTGGHYLLHEHLVRCLEGRHGLKP